MSILVPGTEIHDWFLRHGRAFPDLDVEHDYVGELHACFHNALSLVPDNPHLNYCEGYAHDAEIGEVIAFHHAWLVTPAGKVVDPTWRRGNHRYYGVVFGRAYSVRRLGAMLERGRVGSLLDAWDTDADSGGLLDGSVSDWRD